MAYIKDVQVGSDVYLIQPDLYFEASGQVAAVNNNPPYYSIYKANFELIKGTKIYVKILGDSIGNDGFRIGTDSIIQIKNNGNNIIAGQLKDNKIYGFIYDGTYWQLEGDSSAIKNITRSGTTFTATRLDGSTFTFSQQDSDTKSFTITANATDGLWDLTGTNGTNAVTYALAPYSAKGTAARFYTAATNPTLTTRLNYDGYFYATKLYSNGKEVLTSHQSLAAYAPLASPALTGTPTAPTAANGTSTTQIATTEFVNNTLAYANAMTFKGTLGTGGTVTALPASHEAGDTYRVITAGTWAGKYCEVGTLIICTTDGTAANDAHWTSVETNEDGAVIGPASSTDNAIAVFSGTTGRIIKNGQYVTYLNHVAANAGTNKVGAIDGLLITGSAYGEAENLISNTAGQMSYGDAGPQIRFNSGSQLGALIFNHYDSSSGMGASFHFVTNQGEAAVKAHGLIARTRAMIGGNSVNTSYNLYVNGTSYLNGATTINGNLIFPTANILDWNSDTYRQRIAITDDSTANTAVFTFQQSTDSGSNYTDLFTIKDNGTVVATTFDGNATTATKSGTATMWLYPENGNEINFGGANTSKTLYIGYRAKDSRPIPTKFIFGGSAGAADLQVKTVYLGSGTSSYISSTQYTGNAATATSATRLSYNTTVSTKSGLQYIVGQPTIGSNDGNAKEGSNNSPTLWSYPTGGTAATTVANIQNLRLYWGTDGKYFRDIFLSPNNSAIYHRAVNNGTAGEWFKILDSNNTSAASATGADISVAWNTSTTIATINGTAVKIKIPSNPNTNTTYTFAEGSTNGAFSVTPSGGSAQSVSIHGLGSAAYTASTAYATAAQGTKADNALPCSGGVLTGSLGLKTTSADSPDIVWWYGNTNKEQARIWMGSGGTTKWAPLYRCYKSDGTNLYEGHLVLGDGTGASGSWGISITGSSASCTGNAATATSAGSATHANYLTGFSSRTTTMTWGNQTGSVITCFATPKGGGWGFRDNNPASGQVSMTIDGTVYIKEGAVNVGDAIKSISRSGTTFTYTTLWGNTGTFTQQDTNNAVAHALKTTTKFYITGTESATASTGGDTFDTGIYATTTAGQLNATTFKVNEAVTLQYNATDKSLDFVFA